MYFVINLICLFIYIFFYQIHLDKGEMAAVLYREKSKQNCRRKTKKLERLFSMKYFKVQQCIFMNHELSIKYARWHVCDCVRTT